MRRLNEIKEVTLTFAVLDTPPRGFEIYNFIIFLHYSTILDYKYPINLFQ